MIKILLPVVTLIILVGGVFVYRNYLNDLDSQKELEGSAKTISQQAGGGGNRLVNLEIVVARLVSQLDELLAKSDQLDSRLEDRVESLEKSVNDLKTRLSVLEDNQSTPSAR